MKQIKLILLLLILFASTLFSKSWEIEPNRELVYSTNSGLKLKAVAGISDEHKKLCFLIKKEDNSKFYYSGTMYLEFANGHRELETYPGGKATDSVSKCIEFDIENESNYNVPYSVLAQGSVKVWVEASNGDYFPFPNFYLKAANPIEIENYSITKVSETDDYEKFKMTFSLSRIPLVVKIETDTGRVYYFLKEGKIQSKPDFIEKWIYSSDKKYWDVYFKIKKQNYTQNKWFKLIVQDYRAKSANEFVDSKKKYFTVKKSLDTSSNNNNSVEEDKSIDFKKICVGDIFEMFKNCDKNPFILDFSSGYYDFSIRVVLTENLPSNYNIKIRSEDIFPKWQTFHWSTSSNFQAPEYQIEINSKDIKNIDLLEFEIAIFDSNNEIVQSKSISIQIKHYQEQKEVENDTDFEKLFQFLKKSNLITKLNLENETILYHHFTRAEAALILYEFLKLKNSNFKLPYNAYTYKNPFADVRRYVDYYEAIIALANFKGSDDITVLTKAFDHFNPLENVTRFQFVKMIIEGLDIDKINNFSYIKNYSDYNQLAEDAKIYYATAVKEGIIKGYNNKLLPYDKLTIFQALTILQRVLDFSFYPSKDQFIKPALDGLQSGDSLGIISEIQEFKPDKTPIKIYEILVNDYDNKCKKLSINSQADTQANESYEWSANFGYFVQLPNQISNKEVLFCPTTRMPNSDYVIKVVGTDGFLNFDKKNITIDRYDFKYKKNISDTNPNEIKQNISINKKSDVLKENSIFVFSLNGNLYKDNLKIGIERVSIVLEADGFKHRINDVKWNDIYISFIVPSIKEFYGKNVLIEVNYATNYKHETKYFNAKYEPIYSILGVVESDKNGNYPKYVMINSTKVEIDNFGKFNYIVKNSGNFKIEIDENYKAIEISLNDKISHKIVHLKYINRENNDSGKDDKIAVMDKENSFEYCIQVITHAYNPHTNEEKDFPTPCDVPEGWVIGYPPKTDSSIDLNSDVYKLSKYLNSKSFKMTGIFTQFDFSGVDRAFDWVFVTSNGDVYQLQGNKPTNNNLFGWKKVGENFKITYEYFNDWSLGTYHKVIFNENSWIMIRLDDWDNDGNQKFDWLLFENIVNEGDITNAIYKLDGVTKNGTFKYKKVKQIYVKKENGVYRFSLTKD